MSTQIIAAFRRESHLKGNTLLVATEIAHRMNASGFVRMSYDYLALKVHCCRKTAITQVTKLVQLGLLKKTVSRTHEGYMRNLYTYRGHLVHTASPPVKSHSVNVSPILPTPQQAKESSVIEELERQKKGLRLGLYTEGSDLWQKTCEEIARLEILLAR